jgi:hypothetical protein
MDKALEGRSVAAASALSAVAECIFVQPLQNKRAEQGALTGPPAETDVLRGHATARQLLRQGRPPVVAALMQASGVT